MMIRQSSYRLECNENEIKKHLVYLAQGAKLLERT